MEMQTIPANHNSLVVLPAALAVTVARYANNKAARAALDKAIPADKATLLDAMGNALLATCDRYSLSARSVGAVDGAFTLNDGRTVKLASVKGFTTHDGKRFNMADVTKVFGGRAGYVDLAVS